MKNRAVINLNDKQSKQIHLALLFVDKDTVVYFDSILWK